MSAIIFAGADDLANRLENVAALLRNMAEPRSDDEYAGALIALEDSASILIDRWERHIDTPVLSKAGISAGINSNCNWQLLFNSITYPIYFDYRS
ncbi:MULTISPECIES: hypothetical protein [Deefgea]|uniref:Uncharacterized protein n=1 Tax=Deefgea chitinilytica TaxID=570276 RepID=A0ABS2C8X5_9NEIS|nr:MULTISPECIES: hypothetical protein [Deefgea]MBM5570599.1 hypothetical protein [Deefgea chitinilytica]MBM9887828.1 hypothetical protein [Deefgea sp. CFH1-16]